MDPITIVVAGSAALFFLLRDGVSAPPTPGTPPAEDPCSPERVQQLVLGSVQGAAAGAQTGTPAGAGAGAGLALLGGLTGRDLKCGGTKWNAAKAALCAKAEKVKLAVEARFGDSVIPDSKWKKLSCDEKIAYVAALGPVGVQALLAGALVGAAWNTSAKTVEKWADEAQKATDAVSDATDKVGDWGKSAGDSAKKFMGLK